MMTRLIRVLRTCALGALGFNALLPSDAISGRKLLSSNPRLLRSSQLGETCPTPAHAQAWRFSLAAPMLPMEVPEAASRPGGRLAEAGHYAYLRVIAIIRRPSEAEHSLYTARCVLVENV